jgi:hypothetical protein
MHKVVSKWSPSPRSNKQIAKAGFGLSVKMLALPFIPFKKKSVVNLKTLPPNNMPKKYASGSAGQIRYRVMDTQTGKLKGLALSYKSADQLANKFETGGKYRYTVEKLPPNNAPKKMVLKLDLKIIYY